MSSVSHLSVTSSKHEKTTPEQIESIRAMNSSLQAYLDHLRVFKRNLIKMNDNYSQLSKVNKEWIDALNNMNR